MFTIGVTEYCIEAKGTDRMCTAREEEAELPNNSPLAVCEHYPLELELQTQFSSRQTFMVPSG